MRRVDSSWNVIERVLKEHAHSTYKALRPGASPTQIDRFNALLPRKLPHTFERSLLIHDGLRNEKPFIDYMTLLPLAKIASIWRMQCDLQRECDFPGCSVTKTTKLKNDAHWRDGWVPLMDFNGDKLVIDLDPGRTGRLGQVFRWYNYGGRPMSVVADSFDTWLDILAAELSARRFSLNEFGEIILQNRSST